MLYICQRESFGNKVRFIDLFAGIGGIRLPFDELGYQCVFSSEWDAAAQDTYEANFGERPFGDITKIDAAERYHIMTCSLRDFLARRLA